MTAGHLAREPMTGEPETNDQRPTVFCAITFQPRRPEVSPIKCAVRESALRSALSQESAVIMALFQDSVLRMTHFIRLRRKWSASVLLLT